MTKELLILLISNICSDYLEKGEITGYSLNAAPILKNALVVTLEFNHLRTTRVITPDDVEMLDMDWWRDAGQLIMDTELRRLKKYT